MKRFVRHHPVMLVSVAILLIIAFLAAIAPLLPYDPLAVDPANRLQPPSATAWFGTDSLGRDIAIRSLYGARVSLAVGFLVAAVTVLAGLILGVASGYWRWLDRLIMRFLDGLMAIPSILLAIAMVALYQPGLFIVIVAIAIPEVPRVARLVRSIILSVKTATYVEAATAAGVRTWAILVFHIIPSTIPQLIVQATYIIASAILIEASLSFLGAGMPPEVPTWGNMIAASRLYLSTAPWTIFAPALVLGFVIMTVNMAGDALRDILDVKAEIKE